MYRAIFDAAPYGAAVVEPIATGRHLVVEGNVAFAALFGCTPAEVVGREIEDLLVDPDDDVEPDRDGWFEYHCWDPNGRVIWARWRSVPLPDGPDRRLVFIDQIDDRVRARHQAQRLARLLDLTPEPVIIRGLDGTIVYWNRGAEDTYGHRTADVLGLKTHDLLQTRFEGITLPELERQLIVDGAWQGHLSHLHADGRRLYMQSKHVRDSAGDGKPVILEMNIDVTEQVVARRALEASESKFRLQFRNSVVGQAIHRIDGTIEEANPAMAAMLGYPVEAFVDMRSDVIFDPSATELRRTSLAALVAGETDAVQLEVPLRHASGIVVEAELSGSVTRDPDGNVDRIVVVYQDVTIRKAAERALAHQASHDPLTGLANRTLLLQRLETALAEARTSPRMVGVLYLDLDGFKAVNDTLGHHVGDALLNEVGRRLDHCVRHDDVVARIGGDEFVVLCPDLDSPGRLQTIAERILVAVSEPYELHGHRVDSVTASIGVSYPSATTGADQALRDADRAMYRVKQSGKNNFSLSKVG